MPGQPEQQAVETGVFFVNLLISTLILCQGSIQGNSVERSFDRFEGTTSVTTVMHVGEAYSNGTKFARFQMGLGFAFEGEQMKSPPESFTLTIISYQKASRLQTPPEVILLLNGKDRFRPGPMKALKTSEGKGEWLTTHIDVFGTQINSDQLLTLINARTIEIRIDDKEFIIPSIARKQLREFAAAAQVHHKSD